MKNRPTLKATGSSVTTPLAKTMIRLLGYGVTHEGVTLARNETEALNKMYGFKKEAPQERPPEPVRPPDPEGASSWERIKAEEAHEKAVARWRAWEDPSSLMQAAAYRDMIRHAEHDGLRLVAWLARHVPKGEDPLKTLVQLAVDAGWDVAPEDVTWASDESD